MENNELINVEDYAGDIPATNSIQVYLHQISVFPVMRAEEEQETAIKAIAGDEDARSKMVNSNLRLVVTIANHYRGKGLSFQDLIQEGNLGLMTAVDKFDPELGYKFSTYATWWIKQSITKAFNENIRLIHIPNHIQNYLSKIRHAEDNIMQKYQRPATLEELSAITGLTADQIVSYKSAAQDTASMDATINDDEDGDTCLGDLIADSSADRIDAAILKEERDAAINKALATLTANEADVIKRRFGLFGFSSQTLEQIGESFGISKERVRQLENSAMRKLRHPLRSNILKEFAV